MAEKRGVFRINTYESNKPVTYLVCATSDTEAVAFVGAQDVSGTSATRVQYPVEVAGLDSAHPYITPAPVEKAPFDLPRSVSRAEFDALKAQLDALSKKSSGGPTSVQRDPLAKEK